MATANKKNAENKVGMKLNLKDDMKLDLEFQKSEDSEETEVDLHLWTFGRDKPNPRRCEIFQGIQVKLASLGDYHAIVLTNEHKLFSWGSNTFGQLGLGDTDDREHLCLVFALSDKRVSRLSCGARHSAVICKGGHVYCWGDSRQGQCGQGDKGIFTTPCRVQFVDEKKTSLSSISTVTSDSKGVRIRELACGGLHTLAVDNCARVWIWGTGAATLGLGQKIDEVLFPTKIDGLKNKHAINIACGIFHNVVVVQNDFHGSQFEMAALTSPIRTVSNASTISRTSQVTQKIPFFENVFYADRDEDISEQAKPAMTESESSVIYDADNNLSLQDVSLGYIELLDNCNEIDNSVKENTTNNSDSTLVSNENYTRQSLAEPEIGSESMSCESFFCMKDKGDILPTESDISHDKTDEESVNSGLHFENELFKLKLDDIKPFIDSDDNVEDNVLEQESPTNPEEISVIYNDETVEKQPINDKDGENIKETKDIVKRFRDNNFETEDHQDLGSASLGSEDLDSSCDDIFHSAWSVPHTSLVNVAKNMEISMSNNPTAVQLLHPESTPERCNTMFQCNSSRLSDASLNLTIRTRSNSMWSIATVMNSSEIDRIGSSVPVFGSTEVWTWGKNSNGQLGIGNTKDRYKPTCVDKLTGKGIVRVAAGSYHSLALASYCQVYVWGDNSCGQLGLSKVMSVQPKKTKALSDVRVWDIAGGKNFSLFLGDSDNNTTHIFFSGETERLEKNPPSPSDGTGSHEPKRSESILRKLSNRARRYHDLPDSEFFLDVKVRKIMHFEKGLLLRSISACHNQFSCLTERPVNEVVDVIYKLARSERFYYFQLALIQQIVMDPLTKSEFWTLVTKLPGGEALLPLMDSFSDLLNSVAVGLSQLTDTIRLGLKISDLFSFFFSDCFRAVYDRYSKCYSDTLAVGHLNSCNKNVSTFISKAKYIMKNMFSNLHVEQIDFQTLLKIPLKRSSRYTESVKKLATGLKSSFASKDDEITQLEEVLGRWQDFADINSKRLREAEQTHAFWEECPTKLMEALKDPQRRVVKTSKTDPLSLARASRLSNHSYILFNDVFVHAQFNRNFEVFPLITIWAVPVQDSEQLQNGIRITAPEASFVLVASSSSGRTEWLKELNQAVATCLSNSSSHRITTCSVNNSTGMLPAADAREAYYTFLNHLRYKGARYTGMWMCGLPHGRGRIDWPDATFYEGEFVNGNFHGFGVMVFPVMAVNERDKRYEGEFFEGKMCGYGRMRYGNGDEYFGHFKENVRNGHGTFKSFSNNGSLSTVYVGSWVNDERSGYGVLDFIARGEKYMGMWAHDQRHGRGIVVTVDGVYYEGKFLQNRLAGKGILLNDDDTCYEGEFTADMLLSGKGILTLPNGDYIDGTFSGTWGEGIKVNGTFYKYGNPSYSLIGKVAALDDSIGSQLGLTDFTISADLKWKSLFDECREELGCDGTITPDIQTVWRNLHQSIIKALASGVPRRSIRHKDWSRDALLKRGKNEEGPALARDYKALQDYLSKAFDIYAHPLNTLVEGLVEVYRTTYVGVGAHRRLLLHAVEEAKSYMKRLYLILRLMFPNLPDEDLVLVSNETASGIDEHPIDSTTLLHPLLLPRLYPPLFTLYALHTEKTDAVYAERLHVLNKRKDVALMSFLGIYRNFWLCKFDEKTNSPVKGDRPPYKTAIDALEATSTTYSPMEKIEVIRRSFAKCHEEVDDFWQGKHKLMSMDDLFPVFQYVVIRARIAHLGSEIQFIEDLVDPDVLVGESGHMVTTLKACYFQIQNEQDRE